MSGYGRERRSRGFVVGAVCLVLLVVVVYGALTLVPPLPAATVTPLAYAKTTSFPPPQLGLPADGASAVVAADGSLVATAGSADSRPIAGAAKLVLALATLSAKPLQAGDAGPPIPIGQADVDAAASLSASGARTLPVVLGSTWSEREMLAAAVLGASNNIAESLARWAFGSEQAYVSAATAWLSHAGLAHTTVVDSTGLDPKGVSTATDLATLARLAATDPVLADLYANGPPSSANATYDSYVAYRPSTGIQGLSRSYTDAAGVCLLFALPLPATEGSAASTAYVAIAGMPTYAALSSALDAVVAAAPHAIAPVTVVAKGQRLARLETAWGASVGLRATRDVVVWGLSGDMPPVRIRSSVHGFVPSGDDAGDAVLRIRGHDETVGLVTDGPVRDPGLAWRLLHPVDMIGSITRSL